jgi:DNA processing protein
MKGVPKSRLLHVLAQPDDDLVALLLGAEGHVLLDDTRAIPGHQIQELLVRASCWASCQHDNSYPKGLTSALGSRAPALFGRGDPRLLSNVRPCDSVAIVGSRRATSEGHEVARSLGEDLAASGAIVVSGMAFGIDAWAHRGALEAGRTVAVLACGPDRCYPAAYRSLWERIAKHGLVVSEFPPGMRPWRWTFLARNRIVAALAGVTVVVEAARRGGTMFTANAAMTFGRQVAVARTDSPRNRAGAEILQADGAAGVEAAGDVLRLLPALAT